MIASARLRAAAAVIAAVAVASTGAVTAAGGQAPGKTIRLYEHDTAQASLDLGATGESAGDVYVFAGDTFTHRGGTRVGRAGGTCTTVSTGNAGESLCTVSFTLPGGQVTGQGLLPSAELFGGATLSGPITGGSGRYEGARGHLTIQVPADVPGQTDANFVLHLR